MAREQFRNARNAFYVKLGREGRWAEDSLATGKLRVGWQRVDIDDIRAHRWDVVEQEIRQETADAGAATRDLRALRMLCASGPEDIWITFHRSRLWWCRIRPGILQDDVSKYLLTHDGWRCKDAEGHELLANQIPGRLSRVQAFRGTVCKVHAWEDLTRLLNAQTSDAYLGAMHAKDALISHLERAIRGLHWKDFEILVDLVFRQAGWRRVTVRGEAMKSVDMELQEPVTGDLYQVQVKS